MTSQNRWNNLDIRQKISSWDDRDNRTYVLGNADLENYKKIIEWIRIWEFWNNNAQSDEIIWEVEKILKNSKLSSSKLREYYNEIIRNYNSLWIQSIWNIKLKMYLLLSKIKYDSKRPNWPSEDFVKWFEEQIKVVFKDYNENKFKVFKIWFETLVAVGKTTLKN